MLLKTEGLTVHYGVIKALDNVSFELEEGEILSIIGANGAGKSTLLKTIMGIIRPVSGTITFGGKRIEGTRTDSIVRQGITMVPEGRRIFPDLTVKDNLDLGSYSLNDKALKKELFHLIISTFPRLEERMEQHAGTLSGGEQQMLAMGRALMAHPKLLLLDEPSMGLSPIITREIFTLISTINRERGISMVLVEQNAHMALEHSHRTYVLENGRITMEGASSEIKHDRRVIEAYLGV
ncbi:MAG: High-affinity branched-chain amino acid transport ATP-binding protein LivF [Syntrophorhabdus sp. PtaU1.Bin058]|nr:MAG: High-affinity branched-chain amino acid transport ATP-binding protein LivF [Syntrophorhabdus sp. PtaU1.Bin058]